MKWIQINTNEPAETFELWSDDKKLAGASFNNKSAIVRLVTNAGKRLFFFEKKGWLSPKPVIKNEYGVTLGKLHTTVQKENKGFIELDGKKYIYRLSDNDSAKIEVFDATLNIPVTSCSFNTVLAKGVSTTKSLMQTKFPQLLLLLCWYSLQIHGVNGQEPAVMESFK